MSYRPEDTLTQEHTRKPQGRPVLLFVVLLTIGTLFCTQLVYGGTILEFMGGETGGTEEIVSNSGCLIGTSPSPWTSDETYVIEVDETHYCSGQAGYSSTTDAYVFSINVYFDELTTIPNDSFTCVTINGVGGIHWYWVMEENGGTPRLAMYDANDTHFTSISIPAEDTWYRITVYWEYSDSADWKTYRAVSSSDTDTLIDSGSSRDLKYGALDSHQVTFKGPTSVGGTPCSMFVDSYYLMGDVTDEDDRLGRFRILGPWQPDHASSSGDCSEDGLGSGYWDDIAETPANSSNYVQASGNDPASVCDGTTKDGPSGDSRFGVNDAVQGCSAIFLGHDKGGTKYPGIGEGYGEVCDLVYDATSTFVAGTDQIWKDASSIYCAAEDEYHVTYWHGQTSNTKLDEAWGFSLVSEVASSLTMLDFERPPRGVARGTARGVQ